MQRLEFDDRDVIQNEDGWAGVYLTRNRDLIASGPLGPTAVAGATGPIPTNPKFVYQTPLVRFVNRFTPLLTDQSPIAIAAIGATEPVGTKRPLESFLGDLFDSLLDLGPSQDTTGDYTIRMEWNYAFPLGDEPGGPMPPDARLLVVTPMLLTPTFVIGQKNQARFIADLATALRSWVDRHDIPRGQGSFLAQITVFSNRGEPSSRLRRRLASPSGATTMTQPILDLQDLQLPLAEVEWKPAQPPDRPEEDGPRGLSKRSI